MLVADDLSMHYGSTVALAGVQLTVEPGEVVAVTGSSGSGKTSLLYCLAGLVTPSGGAVRFKGQNLREIDREGLARLRREQFGYVFQFAELVPELTLHENVALPLELLGTRRSQVRRRVNAALEELGLVAQAGRRPAQVSGGQAQRAAVARALVHRPAVVFADEPTGSLDTVNGHQVLTLLLSLSREQNTSIVLVTHDAAVAAAADREIRISDGRVVETQS